MEQELRKKAIKRYLQGETPKSIYSNLGRSKNWFFKWLIDVLALFTIKLGSSMSWHLAAKR